MVGTTDSISDAASLDQRNFLDRRITKVIAAWKTPKHYDGLATEQLRIYQERHLHFVALQDVFTKHNTIISATKRLSSGFTMFEEWVWISGLDEVLELLYQGPDKLLEAYEEKRLVLQGNRTSTPYR